jgi:hypothetical protein
MHGTEAASNYREARATGISLSFSIHYKFSSIYTYGHHMIIHNLPHRKQLKESILILIGHVRTHTDTSFDRVLHTAQQLLLSTAYRVEQNGNLKNQNSENRLHWICGP